MIFFFLEKLSDISIGQNLPSDLVLTNRIAAYSLFMDMRCSRVLSSAILKEATSLENSVSKIHSIVSYY